MEKSNYWKLVDFHLAADGSVPTGPSLPPREIVAIRKTLIQEEYEEVMTGFADLAGADGVDQLERLSLLAHELADLLYVVYGTFASMGIDADAVFAEVHNANMRKMGGPRRVDGKLLKPPGWQPADVRAVIERLNGNEVNRTSP